MLNLKNTFSNFIKYKFFYYETVFFGIHKNTKQILFTKKLDRKKKIAIYGFGPYGEKLFINLFFKLKIVGIYDKNFEVMNNYIEDPKLIDHHLFDYIVVTVINNEARKSVLSFFDKIQIPHNKIILLNIEN